MLTAHQKVVIPMPFHRGGLGLQQELGAVLTASLSRNVHWCRPRVPPLSVGICTRTQQHRQRFAMRILSSDVPVKSTRKGRKKRRRLAGGDQATYQQHAHH